MAYKGEDQDIRTLQSWTPTGREGHDPFAAVLGRGGTRSDTLWVDDVVLATLNDAYDMALVHRAGEVMLEHVLNAMTRIDSAAKVLELNGVRVAGLRRETGTIIASDIPAAFTNGKGAPKIAAEVDDILRLAADGAYARRAPVSIEDLLLALQETRREVGGLSVLRRHWTAPRTRESRAPIEPLPLPPLSRGFAIEEPRERVRAQARSAYIPEVAREPVQSLTDSMQNSRIEALERLVRELSQDLASDRKSMGEVFTGIQRDLMSSRDDTSRFRGGLSDRLHALEQAVTSTREQPALASAQLSDRLGSVERSLELKFADLARTWTVLGDRLQALESAVTNPSAVDFAPVDRRMGDLQRLLSGLSDRLARLETAITDGQFNARPADVDLSPIDRRMVELQRVIAGFGERLGGLEASVIRAETQQSALEPISERLAALERSFQGGLVESSRGWMSVGDKLASLEDMITAPREAVTFDLTPVVERMQLVEGRLGEAGLAFGRADERIRHLEEMIGMQRAALGDLTTRLAAEVKSVSAALASVQAAEHRTETLLDQRLQHLSGAMERQRSELVASLAQPLNERFVAFAAAVDRRQQESGQGLQQVHDRIGRLESQLTLVIEKTAETAAMRDRDLLELHEALVKINGNQQTLASSLDQWRLDTTGDLSVVGNRLEHLERASEQPVRLLQQLSSDVQTMNAAALKREARRSRFRLWMFGTEDWYGDSWGDPGSGRPGLQQPAVARNGTAVQVASPRR